MIGLHKFQMSVMKQGLIVVQKNSVLDQDFQTRLFNSIKKLVDMIIE